MPLVISVSGSSKVRYEENELRDRNEFGEQLKAAVNTILPQFSEVEKYLDSPINFALLKNELGNRNLYEHLHNTLYVLNQAEHDLFDSEKMRDRFGSLNINAGCEVFQQDMPHNEFKYQMSIRNYNKLNHLVFTTNIYMTEEGPVLEIDHPDYENSQAFLFTHSGVVIKYYDTLAIEAEVRSLNQFKDVVGVIGTNIPEIIDQLNASDLFTSAKSITERPDLGRDIQFILSTINLNRDKLDDPDDSVIVNTVKNLRDLNIELNWTQRNGFPTTMEITVFDKRGKPIYLITPYLSRKGYTLRIESYIDRDIKEFIIPRD